MYTLVNIPLFLLRPPFVKLRLYAFHRLFQIIDTAHQVLNPIINDVPSLRLTT